MNDAMWSKRAVQENIAALRRRGVVVVEPESGHLASGHVGAGRLANASALMKAMADAVRSTYDLAGRRVVVTAGGTREPIDLVRYVSNYSSGKMGFAMAAAAADRGARVTLVTTATHPAHEGIDVRPVETADEMLAGAKRDPAGARLLGIAAALPHLPAPRLARGKITRRENPPPH